MSHRRSHLPSSGLVPALIGCLLLTTAGPIHAQSHDRAAPACAGVNRNLTKKRALELAPLIAKQLKSPTPPVEGTIVFESTANLEVKVLESFRFHGWSIILISTALSDDGYLFYRRKPEDGKFVALYAGAAGFAPDDPNGASKAEDEIISYLRQEMSDIPLQLAGCFAWHFVAENRK